MSVKPLQAGKANKAQPAKSPGLAAMEGFLKLKPEEQKKLGESEMQRARDMNKGWVKK
jgi:hypothetical protein